LGVLKKEVNEQISANLPLFEWTQGQMQKAQATGKLDEYQEAIEEAASDIETNYPSLEAVQAFVTNKRSVTGTYSLD
jgi:hypothetical protein